MNGFVIDDLGEKGGRGFDKRVMCGKNLEPVGE